MTRLEIIKGLKNYFAIHELVGPDVYFKYKDNSWFVFQTDALHCLLIMREKIGKPFTINNWFWHGQYDERGFRDNLSHIFREKTFEDKLYLSGHVLGCAFDFKVKNMSSPEVRNWIVNNPNLFPCKIRLENRLNGKPISWVHFDTKYYEKNPKIYLFDV